MTNNLYFTFREATGADLDRILEIHRSAVLQLGRNFYTENQVRAWAAEAIEDNYSIQGRSNSTVVAVHEDEVIAVGQLNTDEPEIAKLFVSPDDSRRGVGSRLLGRLETEAREHSIDRLFLDSSLNATDFYHLNGYTYGTMLNKYLPIDDDEIVYPTLRMWKRL